MAEKGGGKKLDEQLKCAICLDTYTDPKLLQCFHVFCSDCLDKFAAQSQQEQVLTCPTCRQCTRIPSGGVTGLQSAFHVNHLLEIMKNGEMTKDEDKNPSPSPAKKVIPNCVEHDIKRELYCETCGDLICFKCVIRGGKHHDHDYAPLNEAFERYKREMTALLQPMEEKLETVDKALTHLDERCGEVSDQQEVIESDIEDTIRQLHEFLEVKKTELISQLNQVTQEKLNDLAIQKDQIETVHGQLGC